ncbi:hypothetical protein GOP47_0030302 [Adiantum capillus-veneris]|nr:hypothetical protein GOP47_0030302 [Adiantum capillus-veneris]
MGFFPAPGCHSGFNFLNASSHYPPAFADSSVADMARISDADYSIHSSSDPGAYKDELWQACAGPLVSVPKEGQRVWYFPQGHMEQVSASTGQSQGADQLMPQYNLRPQILCRVISRLLNAEVDSDEVFAQLSLLPLVEGEDLCVEEEESLDSPPKCNVRIFTKILTASDTSTHGGFSVLRKHAEDCLPPLDMSQENPSQELTATDLHDQEWKFRHTYRGHPRRHLLTTGWSHFVSQKKLVAGDAVVFLRGANGELRVGIRRTKRQPTSQSSNVLTSDCMHMGVIATAAHAVQTRTMFSVFYKPRASPSSFIVPVEKLLASLSNKLSVGMRFKMRFEGDDATERSYAGTITGIEDLNAARWSNSKWRSLRVNWDEFSNHEQRERISLWEIELCVHPQAPSNLSPVPKSKRIRGASTLDTGGNSKGVSAESSMPSKHPGSFQGHELQASGSGVPHMLTAGGLLKGHRHVYSQQQLDYGSLATDDMVQSQVSPLQGRWLAAGNVDPGQCRQSLYSDNLGQHLGADNVDQRLRTDLLQQRQGEREDTYSFFPMVCHTSGAEDKYFDKSLSIQMHPPANPNVQFAPGLWQPSSTCSSFMPTGPSEVISARPFISVASTSNAELQPGVEKPPSSLQHCSLSPFAPWDSFKQEKPVDNACKLFGFSLTQAPMPSKLTRMSSSFIDELADARGEATSKAPLHLPESELPQQSNLLDRSVSSEPEISDNGFKASKDGDSRSLSNVPPLRSCTKVIKKGSMVGRGIDLSRFDSYKKLIEELEGMFHIEGELSDPDKGWQVAYSDDEGDMMHVGDDPWMEFCRMVRKIYIFSPEEVRSSGMPQAKCSKDEHSAGCREGGEQRESAVPALPG